LWSENRQTIILVTHDLVEAISLADRVVVFTKRPARISFERNVDLPRPRNVSEIRFTERFQRIYNDIWEHLRQEYDEEKL
jgi:NitT/TauT family transport system ATP-binding protein